MSSAPTFNRALLRKYNMRGPRYTSYPSALQFQETTSDSQINLLGSLGNASKEAIGLYIHIPFCHSLCYYCGCNKIVTRHNEKADRYLDYLEKEIQLKTALSDRILVNDIHLGGGTPSFLSKTQISRLMDIIAVYFKVSENAQISIEIDPRKLALDYIDHLADLGFNRLSIGLQDTNLNVQEAINRVQSTSFVEALIKRARACGFKSVNLDLVYGLPRQTKALFTRTLEQVIALNPDRISLFSYAHMPSQFAAQRKIKTAELPSDDLKFSLFQQSIETLTDAGYLFIGMDHFAKVEDTLSKAAASGQLHRNFQGYTAEPTAITLGLGVSAITTLPSQYTQNAKTLNDYYAALDTHSLPHIKYCDLSRDDLIRRDLIQQLMCNFRIDKADFSQRHSIDFDHYFKIELATLSSFISDGMLSIDEHSITILSNGRLLIRNICMSFDAYISMPLHQMRYSRVI